MNEYMIDIELPPVLDQEFIALIPAQRARINELMSRGVVSSYTLSLDRTKLWVVMKATSEAQVNQVFESFPLYDYMQGAIIPLMFHQSLNVTLPQLSMN
jgi:muconolactone delta-isomerase